MTAPYHFKPEQLEEVVATLLEAGGYSAVEAQQTARSLVLSDLSGHPSHGVIRTGEYLYGLKKELITTGLAPQILIEAPNSLRADGRQGLGQVQMPWLLDQLFAKIGGQGVVTGVICNCGHIGRLGEWAERIAAAGYAGMVLANDNGAIEMVAPPGAKKAATSTNPIAFGLPLEDGDFILDFSTAAVAIGKVRLAYLNNETMAEGLLQDAEGTPSTDPAVLFTKPQGALLPMGGIQGYKGFGLSMIVDMLAAGLTGGYTPPAPDGTPVSNNTVITIWNPEHFAGLPHFREQAQKYADYVLSLPSVIPGQGTRIPGMRSRAIREEYQRDGIPVSMATCKTLARSAEITGVAQSQDQFLAKLKSLSY